MQWCRKMFSIRGGGRLALRYLIDQSSSILVGGREKAPSEEKIKIRAILVHFEPISTILFTFHHNFNPYPQLILYYGTI